MKLGIVAALCVGASALAAGCAPKIGDSCSNSADCSVDGERVCDVAQPGGYCTIAGCDPDSCPDGALCVEWRFMPARTSATWCMEDCRKDGDCRQKAGYRCVHQGPSGTVVYDGETILDPTDAPVLARITDIERRDDKGFCAAVVTSEK